jgi:hypothetical protein
MDVVDVVDIMKGKNKEKERINNKTVGKKRAHSNTPCSVFFNFL